ncbi:MAG: hypothetical protein AAF191_12610, partial [Verrucomicrobiota bacterium]
KLRVVAKGLTYLQSQYEKPLSEFRELEGYLAQKVEDSAVSADPGDVRFERVRRMFVPGFREQLDAKQSAFDQEMGMRQAYVDAQQAVTNSYTSAQEEMSAIRSRFGKEVGQLDQLIASHQDNTTAMTSFFEVSSELLQIHQKVMDVDLTGSGVEPVDLKEPTAASVQP